MTLLMIPSYDLIGSLSSRITGVPADAMLGQDMCPGSAAE